MAARKKIDPKEQAALKRPKMEQLAEAGRKLGTAAVVTGGGRNGLADMGDWWWGIIAHSSGQERVDMVGVVGRDKNKRPIEFIRQFKTGQLILLPQVAIDALEEAVTTEISLGIENMACTAAMMGNMMPAEQLRQSMQMDSYELRHGRLWFIRSQQNYHWIPKRKADAAEIGM